MYWGEGVWLCTEERVWGCVLRRCEVMYWGEGVRLCTEERVWGCVLRRCEVMYWGEGVRLCTEERVWGCVLRKGCEVTYWGGVRLCTEERVWGILRRGCEVMYWGEGVRLCTEERVWGVLRRLLNTAIFIDSSVLIVKIHTNLMVLNFYEKMTRCSGTAVLVHAWGWYDCIFSHMITTTSSKASSFSSSLKVVWLHFLTHNHHHLKQSKQLLVQAWGWYDQIFSHMITTTSSKAVLFLMLMLNPGSYFKTENLSQLQSKAVSVVSCTKHKCNPKGQLHLGMTTRSSQDSAVGRRRTQWHP